MTGNRPVCNIIFYAFQKIKTPRTYTLTKQNKIKDSMPKFPDILNNQQVKEQITEKLGNILNQMKIKIY